MSPSNLGVGKSITKQQNQQKQLIPPPVKTLISTPIKNNSFATKPGSTSTSSGELYNSSLPLFMLSHIHNQKGSSNRIYPENSPERKTHDSLLRSPHGSHKVVSGGKKRFTAFNDEANMIERMESRKVLDYDTLREITLSIQERRAHAHSQRCRENVVKMHRIRRRSGRYIEFAIEEDQEQGEFKSVSILEASGILKDVDVSRSSTCTYDLIDQSVSSNSK